MFNPINFTKGSMGTDFETPLTTIEGGCNNLDMKVVAVVIAIFAIIVIVVNRIYTSFINPAEQEVQETFQDEKELINFGFDQGKSGNIEGAEAAYKKAIAAAVESIEEDEPICDIPGEGETFQDAIDTADRIIHPCARARDLINYVITLHKNKGREFLVKAYLQKAIRVFRWFIDDHIEGSNHEVFGLINTAIGQEEAGDIAGAVENYKKAITAANRCTGIIEDLSEYDIPEVDVTLAEAEAANTKSRNDRCNKHKRLCAIAVAQAKAGKIEGAKATAKKIKHNTVQYEKAIRAISIAQAEDGDIVGAKKTTAFLSFPLDRAAALRKIAVLQVKDSDMSGVLATFHEAISVVNESNCKPQDKGYALLLIVFAQEEAGLIEEAKATAMMITPSYVNLGAQLIPPDDLGTQRSSSNMTRLERGDASEKKLKALRFRVRYTEHQMNALMSIADILSNIAATQATETVITVKLEIANLITDPHCKALALSLIALDQASFGDTSEAEATFAEAIAVAEQIKYGPHKALTLSVIDTVQKMSFGEVIVV